MLSSVWILPQVRSLTQSGQFDAGADPYRLPPFYGQIFSITRKPQKGYLKDEKISEHVPGPH